MTPPIEGHWSIPEAVEQAGGAAAAAALRAALESGALIARALLRDGRVVTMIPECWRRAVTRDDTPPWHARRPRRALQAAAFDEAMAGRAVPVALAQRASGRFDWSEGQALIAAAELARWRGGAPAEPAAPVSAMTGAPGRPSGMHLVEREHARRCAEGRALGSVGREAAQLAAWFRAEHPGAPPPTAKTIENRIRAAHRRHHAPGASAN